MSNGYKNLKVWKKSYELTLEIYRITKKYPKEETYGITSQMRRASASIIANLAEGYSAGYLKEYIRYVSKSIGSNNELEVYLDLSRDLDYLKKNEYDTLRSKQDEIGKMLFGLRKSLRIKI